MNDAVPVPKPSDFGTLEELECRGRLVFLRTDPSMVSLAVGDSTESSSSPMARGLCSATLRRLLDLEARVIVATHLSGQQLADEGLSSLEEFGMRLSEQMRIEVLMPDDCLGDAVKMVTGDLREGQVCLLPDLLSNPGEAPGEEGFARALSQYCDSYVGDAFAASHLKYSSLTRLPHLCGRKALGLNARRELSAIQGWLSPDATPRLLIVGGQHFSEKIGLIDELLSRVQSLHLTGGVANTVLAATGTTLGTTAIQEQSLARARSLLLRARDLGVKVTLPIDARVQGAAGSEIVDIADVPSDAAVMDIGPASVAALQAIMRRSSGMLIWGPAGRISATDGQASTLALLESAGTARGPRLVLGQALRKFTLEQPESAYSGIDWVITGSEAAKEGLTQGSLPAIEALRNLG